MKFHVDRTYSARVTDRLLGYVGETDARRIEAVFEKEAEAELYVLRLDYGDGKIYEIDLTDGSAKVPGSLLSQEQTVLCQFCALHCDEDGKYTLVRKTNVFEGVIRQGIGTASAPVPAYEECAKAVAELRMLSEAAESAKQSAAAAKEAAEAAAAGINPLGITAAAVGQTVKVKTVDADGYPTSWEAADMPVGGGGSKELSLIATVDVTDLAQGVTKTLDNPLTDIVVYAQGLKNSGGGSSWRIHINNPSIVMADFSIGKDPAIKNQWAKLHWNGVFWEVMESPQSSSGTTAAGNALMQYNPIMNVGKAASLYLKLGSFADEYICTGGTITVWGC